MSSEATYVFMDLGTTDDPNAEEGQEVKLITELSMAAVRRDLLLKAGEWYVDRTIVDSEFWAELPRKQQVPPVPRVQLKLTLCFNPGTGQDLVTAGITQTAFTEPDLKPEKSFIECFHLINDFLNNLTGPVYFVAHNGFKFDFAILKQHLNGREFTRDIMCVDTYYGFYDILETRKSTSVGSKSSKSTEASSSEENRKSTSVGSKSRKSTEASSSEENRKSTSVGNKSRKSTEASSSEENRKSTSVGSKSRKSTEASSSEENRKSTSVGSKSGKYTKASSSVEDVAELVAKISLSDSEKAAAEKNRLDKLRKDNADRVERCKGYPWGSFANKPDDNYTVSAVYERVTKHKPEDAHKGDIDCQLMLRTAVKLSKEFVAWADENHSSFKKHVKASNTFPKK